MRQSTGTACTMAFASAAVEVSASPTSRCSATAGNVFRQRVASTQQQRMRTRRPQQRESGAWRQAHPHAGMLATAPDQRLHVGHQCVAGMHLEHRATQRDHAFGIQQWRGLRDQVAAVAAGQQGALRLFVGIAQREPQEEAVKLRIR
jgi:hypothetical protein